MSGPLQPQGLREHDEGLPGPDGTPVGPVDAAKPLPSEEPHNLSGEGTPQPPLLEGGVEGDGEEGVMEEVGNFLDKLVADVADRVDEAHAADVPVKVGVVHDEDMENLRNLLDNLLDDNTQDGHHHQDHGLEGQHGQLFASGEAAADVCQQTGAVPQHDLTEEGEAAASPLPLPARDGGEEVAGGARSPQRSPRPNEELAGAAIDADVAAAALGPAQDLAHDLGGGLDDVLARNKRKGRSASRTRSRTRRHKQRTARSSSARSSRSRSSRSRDDARSRSRHKRSRKHKRHRRHHHKQRQSSREPLLLNVDTVDSAGPVSPRVNPVFLWVKQEECRILSVVCEDYDRRNRITLTKTTNGWRAIPKTERFAAALCPKRPSFEEDARSHTASSGEGEDEDDDDDEAPIPEVNEDVCSDAEAAEAAMAKGDSDRDESDENSNQRSEGNESVRADAEAGESRGGEEENENMAVMECREGEKEEGLHDRAETEGEDSNVEDGSVEDDVRNAESQGAEGETLPHEHRTDAEDEKPMDADEQLEAAELEAEREIASARREQPETEPPYEEEEENESEERLATSPPPSLVAEDTFGPSHEAEEESEPTKDTEEESHADGEVDLDEMCKEAVANMEEACKKMQEELQSCADLEGEAQAEMRPAEEDEVAARMDSGDESTSERRTESPRKRPCSVLELLNLEESEHVVRLPADLEVSLVGGSPSPRPTASPRPLDTTAEPLRLGAATTITPIGEPPDQGPVKQQHKFLESLLASPRKSDLEQELPLDLGSRKAAARERPAACDPPPLKKPKLDDLTLRNLLNRLPGSTAMSPVEGEAHKEAVLQQDVKRIKSKRPSQDKSRLMELLAVPEAEMDPLAQLKQVLSDPDLVVPDPLLVPRARLQALVTSPAQEIPRLLAQKQESRVPYATPSLDNDLCVVSLSHLQSLLQPEAKTMLAAEEYTRKLLEAQMMWLPYLEAAYSYPGGYLPGYDFKTQVELQTALAAAWQETLIKGSQDAALLKGTGLDAILTNNNNNNYKKPIAPPAQSPKMPGKSASPMPRKSPSPAPFVGTPRHLSAAYGEKQATKYAPSFGGTFAAPAPPAAPPAGQQQGRLRPVPAALPLDSPALFAAPQRPFEYQQQQQQRRELEKQQRRELERQQRREYERQQEQRREYEKQQEYHQQLILLQQLQLQQQILAQQQQEQQQQQQQQHLQQQQQHLQQQHLQQQHLQQQRAAAAYSRGRVPPLQGLAELDTLADWQVDRPRKSEGSRPPTCKSLLNLLSAQREAQQQQQQQRHESRSEGSKGAPESALLAALGSPLAYPTAPHRGPRHSPAPASSPSASTSPGVPCATAASALPGAPVLDLSGGVSRRSPGPSAATPPGPAAAGGSQDRRPSQGAKLKVKNLVDPNAKPRLLKLDAAPVPATALPPDDVAAHHLWHPLFSSQSQKSYNSPWHWTTVTVNGE